LCGGDVVVFAEVLNLAGMCHANKHIRQDRRASKCTKSFEFLPLILSGRDLVRHGFRFLAKEQVSRQSPSSDLLKLVQSVIIYWQEGSVTTTQNSRKGRG